MFKIFSQNNILDLVNEVAEQLTTQTPKKPLTLSVPEGNVSKGTVGIALQNAWVLISHLTGKTRLELITHPEITLTPDQRATLKTWITQITVEHKPIQYLIGSVPFLDLTITVRPPILIPRPETEEWCDQLIQQLKAAARLNPETNNPLNILDLCTGSGCIALALARAFPTAHVIAIDIEPKACALAQENARINDIENIKIIESDLFSALPDNRKFDLIVSNPPYIAPEILATLDPEVREWEAAKALIAEDHGLACIKTIIAQAPAYFAPNSNFNELWIEISPEQETAVMAHMQAADFTAVTPHYDLTHRVRVISGKLIRRQD